MSLAENLALAQLTMVHVRTVLPYGSDNRNEDRCDPAIYREAIIRNNKIVRELNDEFEEFLMFRDIIGSALRNT